MARIGRTACHWDFVPDCGDDATRSAVRPILASDHGVAPLGCRASSCHRHCDQRGQSTGQVVRQAKISSRKSIRTGGAKRDVLERECDSPSPLLPLPQGCEPAQRLSPLLPTTAAANREIFESTCQESSCGDKKKVREGNWRAMGATSRVAPPTVT